MPEDVRAEYRATPEEERFARFGPYLLELQEREALIEPWLPRLSEAERRSYWRLEGLDASRSWLAQRFPTRREESP